MGRLSLPFETLTLPGRPDLLLSVLTPYSGSVLAEGVRQLADWAEAQHALSARVDAG
ncbi:hypothetical protein ACF1GY_34040 [Streptomyces sp. NPDC014684]|uniref:hypothetical protein n=1 Tax=Streptomyces sp. NPDC014684 TaxID=3364880 RepID=UPI0036F55B3C